MLTTELRQEHVSYGNLVELKPGLLDAQHQHVRLDSYLNFGLTPGIKPLGNILTVIGRECREGGRNPVLIPSLAYGEASDRGGRGKGLSRADKRGD